MIIDCATESDLVQVAEVFSEAFEDSIRHVYGRAAQPPAVVELFRLCLAAEREAFLVARDKDRVIGYCFAPERVRRLWGAFFTRGFAWRWAVGFFTGRLGVGWLHLRRLLPDKFAFLSTAARTGFGGDARILSVGVRRSEQGRGVGRALVEAALERFDRLRVPVVQLEVRPWNAPALHLYQSLGFSETGRTRDTQGEWVIMGRRGAPGRPVQKSCEGGQVK
ncbi:MAG: N-acetyltransferase family protein [Betaproteobacteria bacterium]